MDYKIALLPGDGIGPELVEATLKVIDVAEKRFGLRLGIEEVEAGDGCLERTGVALPKETIETIRKSNACLKGPVGETAADVIVKLRILFDLYANIRPIKVYPSVPASRPDIDFVIVRENTEDVYKGIEFMLDDTAICLRVITERGCRRIAKKAFEIAKERKNKRVTAIHKANVMKLTCGLFAKVCREIAKKNPDITFDEQYVDAAAMRLIREPQTFDVIVTTNMFGDILSDEAAQLVGGLGMAPAANIGDDFALFEPVHGSAPDIAGKQRANPSSMILSTSMMFNWLGKKYDDSKCLLTAKANEDALIRTLKNGITVPDLGGNAKTMEMGEAVAKEI
jgi:3-isopropylmalate dehydrogenase